MRSIFTSALIFAVALAAADPAREQALQRAIDLMESKGDVAKAMPLFEEASRSADKALAARALLYVGQGQERQGFERARATYERIVREFGGQTETVSAARKRLAVLGNNPTTQTITQRLVCGTCGDGEADLSPDGSQLAITDWDTGDLALRDVSTGNLKRLLVKANSWKESSAYAEAPEFSPDGRQIAYLWENEDDTVELRVVASEPGAKPRVVLHTRENRWYEPFAWTRDGKTILTILTKPDRTWQIASVPAGGGETTVLKSLEWRLRPPRMGKPSLSPDGRYIAYAALAVNPPTANGPSTSTEKRIYVLAIDGSVETALVKTAGINEAPVWTGDGRHLLFTSDRLGSTSLWSIAMKDGKAAGSPALVVADIGRMTPNGMLRHSLYYTADPAGKRETVRIAKAGLPSQVSDGFVGTRPAWSPDGKQLAFFRNHSSGENNYNLVVHTLENGEEMVYSFEGLLPTVRWFPDGKALQTVAFQSGMKTPGLFRVDLKSREFKLFLPYDPNDIAGGISALSLDQRTVYVAGREPGNLNAFNRVEAVDVATGSRRVVVSFPTGRNMEVQLSPDGRTLAFRRRVSNQDTRYSTVAVDGTGFREVHSARDAQHLSWTRDSKGILFTVPHERNKWKLMRVPAQGGQPEAAGFEGTDSFQAMDFSPDGTRMVFSAKPAFQQLWAIDNVLSALP